MTKPEITKRILADGLKTLMTKYPLAKISVSDIVEECELNRNTFYYHFKDKFDLVNWIFYSELAKKISEDKLINSSKWLFIERICAYLYDNKVFYVNALSFSGQNSFAEYYLSLLKTIFNNTVDDEPEHDYEDEYLSFFLEALVNTTLIWLKDGAKIPPDEFIEKIKQAAAGIAKQILEEVE